MTTPIKTPAGEILALRLPKGVNNIKIVSLKDPFTFEDTCCQLQYGFPMPTLIGLPEGNWQILGPISHKGEFGFDPEPYVEIKFPPNPPFQAVPTIQNAARTFFIRKIESQGEILWSNPIGDEPTKPKLKPSSEMSFEDYDKFADDRKRYIEWQSYEDKRVKETEQAIVLARI